MEPLRDQGLVELQSDPLALHQLRTLLCLIVGGVRISRGG